jgi:hypothetical protein
LYDAATTDARKTLNRAFFTRLYLDSIDRQPSATRETLAEPVASLVHASRATNPSGAPGAPGAPDDLTEHRARLFALCLRDQSLSKPSMVEVLASYSHSVKPL